MPSFGFKHQFAELVETGAKCQTIRTRRKHMPRIGQIAYCFENLRRKNCRRLGGWTIKSVLEVWIYWDHINIQISDTVCQIETISLPIALDLFAQMDGFKDWKEMSEFFKPNYGRPMTLIKW
jgi:hypothetical protein